LDDENAKIEERNRTLVAAGKPADETLEVEMP
jgi:hypothetical protein